MDDAEETLYGRNRQSIADIEENLRDIFMAQPGAHVDEQGSPVISADSLVHVIHEFQRRYGGEDLMNEDQIHMLRNLLTEHPNLTCTPSVLVGWIASQVRPNGWQRSDEGDEEGEEQRGRGNEAHDGSSDRSNSNESTGTRRASSRPPQTPTAPTRPSVFDRRQRTTPIGQANPPSSFSHRRPVPASRRKSIDGATSDSERSGLSSSTGGRRRAPSNPPTPSSSTSPYSGPHSRAASQPVNDYLPTFSPPMRASSSRSSSEDENHNPFGLSTPQPRPRPGRSRTSPSPPPSPSPPSSSSDRDDDSDEDVDLIREYHHDRTISTASVATVDREDILSQTITELQRKLAEAEATYQRKIAENESDIDDLQNHLQELRNELANAKRQGKELGHKEQQNGIAIQALEAEVGRLQKSLESSKSANLALREQYQDQCQLAERYRTELRERESDIVRMREAESGLLEQQQQHAIAMATFQDRVTELQDHIQHLQQAQDELTEQKNENLILKETIDRMRFETDELRAGQAGGLLTEAATKAIGGKPGSERGSVGKSLGAEMLGKMKFGYRGAGQDDGEEGEGEESEEGNSTIEEEVETVVESSDEEFQTETVITRRKRVKKGTKGDVIIEKHYSDSAVQYDEGMFTKPMQEGGVQTDVMAVEKEVQIVHVDRIIELEKRAAPKETSTMEIQTDATEPEVQTVYVDRIVELEKEVEVFRERQRNLVDLSVQTDVVAEQVEVKPVPEMRAPDAPPAYEEDEEERITRKLHPHLALNPKGISREALEEWRNLKEETGIDCAVIERLLESAAGPSSTASTAGSSASSSASRRSRFYNIYNTYIYPESTPAGLHRPVFSWVHLSVGVLSTAMVFYLTSAAQPHYQMIPGGPTVYDREAWSAFNRLAGGGEGMLGNAGAGDGTDAVWSFLQRGVNGAAMYARGFPT